MRTGLEALAADQEARNLLGTVDLDSIRTVLTAEGVTGMHASVTHGGEMATVVSAQLHIEVGAISRLIVQYDDVPVPITYEVSDLHLRCEALPLIEPPAL